MKPLWGAVLMLTAVSRSVGQWETSFSGYVVTLPAYLALPTGTPGSTGSTDSIGISRSQLMDVTRLRLRPSLSLPWNGLLELEYEMAGIVQSTNQPVTVEQKEIGRQVVDLRWTIAESDHYSLIHFIDRLVYRQRLDFGEICIGRQRISWGTGRIWNPTDLFNPINPANFAKIEKDGADAVSAKINLGPLSDVQAVWNPALNAVSNYGGRLRAHSGEYDFSFLGGYFDGKSVAGGDLAGNLGEMGVRGEILVSGIGQKTPAPFVKYIVGIDHQLTPELYALLEYQFNGQGTSDRDAYDFEALYRGEILNVARHYLAVSGSYLIHPLVTLTAMGTLNFDDGSQFYAGTVSYSAGDNVVLGLGLQAFVADVGDEFWYYPGTAYLKFEFHF
jgi:hypothetical protein